MHTGPWASCSLFALLHGLWYNHFVNPQRNYLTLDEEREVVSIQ